VTLAGADFSSVRPTNFDNFHLPTVLLFADGDVIVAMKRPIEHIVLRSSATAL
jgi:hypothetical protein